MQICKKKKIKKSQNKKSMIMKIEIKIMLKWKFEMKRNKYEIRNQNVQNEKNEDRNIKIIKVFLKLNR